MKGIARIIAFILAPLGFAARLFGCLISMLGKLVQPIRKRFHAANSSVLTYQSTKRKRSKKANAEYESNNDFSADHLSSSECESATSTDSQAVYTNGQSTVRHRSNLTRDVRDSHERTSLEVGKCPVTVDLQFSFYDNSEAANDPKNNSSSKQHVSLQNFEAFELVGAGSFAQVYRARVQRSGETVALKIVQTSLIRWPSDYNYLRNEMRVLRVAANSVFLCNLLAAFSSPHRVCFVLPLAAFDLLHLLELRGRGLREDEARFYVAQLLLAIEFLHRHAILYRDLKPDNVLVCLDGYIKLADFGMCKFFHDDDAKLKRKGPKAAYRTRTFCGSLTYMAPETLRGEAYAFSCDFWSLGVLLFELLTARSPFAFVSEDVSYNGHKPAKQNLNHLFQNRKSSSIRSCDTNFIDRVKQENSELVAAILEKPIHTPRTVSVQTGCFLKALFQREPARRLGCVASDGNYVQLGPANLLPGIDATMQPLKTHAFFRSLDWDALLCKSVEPPFLNAGLIRDSAARKPASAADLAINTDALIEESESSRASRFDFSVFDFVNPEFSV